MKENDSKDIGEGVVMKQRKIRWICIVTAVSMLMAGTVPALAGENEPYAAAVSDAGESTDIQDTYAFGDSMNDFEMIEAAGCGVVMGGGADVVKEKADFVTKELREDGIYYACRELGLL